MAHALGNVIWVTSRGGLASENMSTKRIKELIEDVNRLKRERKETGHYQFIITFDDGRVVTADDIWIKIGAEIGDY